MNDQNSKVVDGFLFASEKEAELAREEMQKIYELEHKMDYTNREQVALIYHKSIEHRVFKTPIGTDYLLKLQRFLVSQGEEEIKPIPLYHNYGTSMREGQTEVKQRIKPNQKKKQKMSFKTSLFLNIILIIMVVSMFLISLNGKNPNILNYKNALVNQYASWEQELSKREEVIREKEQLLNITEEQ